MTQWAIDLVIQDQDVAASHRLYGTDQNIGIKPTEEIAKKLNDLMGGMDSGILPPVIRWISPLRRFVILERPPQIMSVNYYGVRQMAVRGAKLQEYDIPLPWTTYLVSLDAHGRPIRAAMFATNGPIQTAEDKLFVLPFTNTYANGNFCLPILPEIQNGEVPEKPWTLGDGANAGYQLIWESNFNTDITETVTNAFQNKRPQILFPENPNDNYLRVSPAKLLKRWQGVPLEEIVEVRDWPLPNINNDMNLQMLMNDAKNEERVNYNANLLYNTIRQMFA